MAKTKRILGIAVRIVAFLAVAYAVGYLVGLAVKAMS